MIKQTARYVPTGFQLLREVPELGIQVYGQIEPRVSAIFYGGKRSNMPYFGGLEPRAWTLKGMTDFISPSAAVTVVALLKSWIG